MLSICPTFKMFFFLVLSGIRGDPIQRPFSVQSNRSHAGSVPYRNGRNGHAHRNGHSHKHPPQSNRYSRGGFLPMGPVFQTVTIEKGPHALGGDSGGSNRSTAVPIRRLSTSFSLTGEDLNGGSGFGGATSPLPPTNSFKPPPRPQPLTQEEIDRDVQIVLQNLGVDSPAPSPITPSLSFAVNEG